jgi:hypothetical protein
MDHLDFVDNPAHHRFELRKAGEVAAIAEYQLLQHAVKFTHTEVQPRFEGQGLGSKIAKAALDEVRRRGLQAIPQCPFIAAYIGKHPAYLDLVAEEHRKLVKQA